MEKSLSYRVYVIPPIKHTVGSISCSDLKEFSQRNLFAKWQEAEVMLKN